MKSLSEYKIALISLLSLAFVAFLGKSYENTLRGIDSNIHAEVSMSATSPRSKLPKLPMTAPHVDTSYDTQSNFNDHPFFFFWMNGTVMRALGPSGWSARVLTATFSVGCILLTVGLGTLLHSRLLGFIAGIFLLFTRDIILTGATVSLDPVMMFFILLSFLLWKKNHWKALGITVGIGLWIKTPVVLLVYPTAFLVHGIRGELQENLKKLLTSFAISIGLGSMIWVITGVLGGWQLVQDYWIRQVWGTAIGGRNQIEGSSPWMFFRMIRNGFLPGLPFLILGLIQIVRKKLLSHPAVMISGVAVVIVGLAITPMRFRMDYYFNPIFPFLAILAAFSIHDVLRSAERSFYTTFSCLVPPALAFLLCTPTTLGPEAFVALKRFIPFIQSYGNCDDDILLVSGGEPIGSSHDYGLVLSFYTGRRVDVESCTTAGASIRKNRPEWVVISQDNLNQCLHSEERNYYSTQIRMGSQVLLSDVIPKTAQIDLSPLERELKPIVDCMPQPYPRDIYHRGFRN
jgi:hypothetical protein